MAALLLLLLLAAMFVAAVAGYLLRLSAGHVTPRMLYPAVIVSALLLLAAGIAFGSGWASWVLTAGLMAAMLRPGRVE